MLVIIGSGETSPTMVTVHRDLLARLGVRRPRALLLATPYAFQENAASVSARAQRYFSGSVGLDVCVTPGTSDNAGPGMAPPMHEEHAPDRETPDRETPDREAADISTADWVFAGPGSPSYAIAHWRAGPVAEALRERILAGPGLTVLASAAAATAGEFALPVYEIYKAGGAPRWLPGLDLMGALGLKVAVIPHYDNTEGGHYDTRYCYLGERRLAVMERELPADGAVLGVDEHTAVLIDTATSEVEIRGRGGVTVRRAGQSVIVPSGARLTVAELRGLVKGVRRVSGPEGAGRGAARSSGGHGGDGTSEDGASGDGTGGDGTGGDGIGGDQLPLPELMARAERGFEVAARERDAAAMAGVILELETAIKQWEADTDEDQGPEHARALLRGLIGRLGQAAQTGLADPRDRLRPAVEPLIALRNTLRGEGNFAAADAIRQALAAAAIDLGDTPEGTRWRPGEPV